MISLARHHKSVEQRTTLRGFDFVRERRSCSLMRGRFQELFGRQKRFSGDMFARSLYDEIRGTVFPEGQGLVDIPVVPNAWSALLLRLASFSFDLKTPAQPFVANQRREGCHQLRSFGSVGCCPVAGCFVVRPPCCSKLITRVYRFISKRDSDPLTPCRFQHMER